MIQLNNKYINAEKIVADSISSLYTNNLTFFPKPGLDKEKREILEQECVELFDEIRSGNLDFVTDALVSHIIILNNVVTVCHKKAEDGYFKEYTDLSIKAADQLRKSGLALAQIKNAIVNIENLTLQQNNLLLLNAGESAQESTQEVAYDKTMVRA